MMLLCILALAKKAVRCSRSGARIAARLVFGILLLGALVPAQAHKPSDSYLSLKVAGNQVTGQWDIALRDLDLAVSLDLDGDGRLTWDEVRSQHHIIAPYALERLDIASAAGKCAIAAGEQLIDHHTDGAYTVLRFSATCLDAPETLTINYRLFADLDPQHKGLARIEHDGATTTAIFSPDKPRQVLSLVTPSRLTQFGDYVVHGVWHIWIGFDHILFLLSLLLPAVLAPWLVCAAGRNDAAGAAVSGSPPQVGAQSLKGALIDVFKVVTAFTLAHSITLTLASLHVVALPSRLVESAIAASVVLAALNNIVPLFRRRRPLVAFMFGLIHGFGFAGVLADLGLPQGALIVSLLGFNVGVELGQLAIVAVFVPLAFATRRTWFYRQMMGAGSAVIALIALVWLVERAFDLTLMPA